MSTVSYVLILSILVETCDISEALAPRREQLANHRKEINSHQEKCGGRMKRCIGPTDCGPKKEWACLQLKCHLAKKGKVSGANCSKRCCPKEKHHADLKAKGQMKVKGQKKGK